MILNRSDGSTLDLSKYKSLAWHLKAPACHVADIVAQINGGLYRDVPLSGTVLDLGANCGLFTAYAQPAAKRIIAVEPSPRHYKALVDFLDEAKLSDVALSVNAAVWTYDGRVKIQDDAGNRTMDRIDYHARAIEATTWAVRLDTLMRLCHVDCASFVKMDIEGAEEDVLGSESFALAAPRIDYIWVECHNYKNWDSGLEVGNRVEALVRRHFPTVERKNQDLVIGRRN